MVGQQTERGKIAEDIGALASASRSQPRSARRSGRHWKTDRPVVIDVVSDMDAMAAMAANE